MTCSVYAAKQNRVEHLGDSEKDGLPRTDRVPKMAWYRDLTPVLSGGKRIEWQGQPTMAYTYGQWRDQQ